MCNLKLQWNNLVYYYLLLLHVLPSITHLIMKGQQAFGEQAFGEVTHALMRKHYPYRPGHPGAHLCLAKSMVETPTMAAP